MSMTPKKFRRLIKNFSVALGIIIIWRGIWYTLDYIDLVLFGGGHILSSLGGIVIGVVILYLLDPNLEELGRL